MPKPSTSTSAQNPRASVMVFKKSGPVNHGSCDMCDRQSQIACDLPHGKKTGEMDQTATQVKVVLEHDLALTANHSAVFCSSKSRRTPSRHSL